MPNSFDGLLRQMLSSDSSAVAEFQHMLNQSLKESGSPNRVVVEVLISSGTNTISIREITSPND